ncbi:hypothetical protein N7478_002783 [Penicillium angulare]|uniref:uncharacterized protein n=1 Tax=Penicillium angulare TaxID=116970 RepID=UPI0025420A51|nr:uncharacterized protein N7478_002783 [Penicillium angulare]KAJ5287097.1 hypothetical protein N7478_002783 [Penicillium angulare]
MSLPTQPRTWKRDNFLVSTDKRFLSIAAINGAFQQDLIYWANAVPDEILQQIIDSSFCFGLYRKINTASNENTSGLNSGDSVSPPSDNLEQIGFARLITDNITFAYITDLYVLPEYQGFGLGGWIIDCLDEVLEPLPYLRWAMLRTSMLKSQESYEKRLGMEVLKSGSIADGPVMMGKRGRAGRA